MVAVPLERRIFASQQYRFVERGDVLDEVAAHLKGHEMDG